MRPTEILVIGGGPAGLCAALAASSLGAGVLLSERDGIPGGQLVKQTHKFFGSEKQYAGDRGIHIGDMLLGKARGDPNIEIWTDSTVLAVYEDGVVTVEHEEQHTKVKPECVVIATGAAEKFLAFPGNDLPGIYGAGAVQTLMNVAGVKPAERVLMVGAGNIGLIVSYQLKQAGVEVAAVIEGLPTIGGYIVHASKIQRAGIPVLTRHTILEAYGAGQVEGAVIAEIDEKWQPVPGTEWKISCDAICLAVGLSPLTELAWQAGCEMAYIHELSGHVPLVDEYLQTTRPGIYCAGDVSGIEEASSAMVEGRLAGLSVAVSLGYGGDDAERLRYDAISELEELRAGPMGRHIRIGLEKAAAKRSVNGSDMQNQQSAVAHTEQGKKQITEALRLSLLKDGIPKKEDLAAVCPSDERFAQGPVAIVECFQEIPCDPCVKACSKGAISMHGKLSPGEKQPGDKSSGGKSPDTSINALPVVDAQRCNGCGLCIPHCPGLAIFVVDKSYNEQFALVRIPFEFVPLPEKGQFVTGLDRAGNELGRFEAVKVASGGVKNMTYTISLAVPQELAMEVRGIRVGGYGNGK